MQKLLQDAGLALWEFCTPPLLVLIGFILYWEYGWTTMILYSIAVLAAAALAWSTAWKDYRRRHQR